MRVFIEISVDIEHPAALIAVARQEYARSVTAVDVDGMSEEEALAVADLTPDELRAHPRSITPEQAIADGAAAALRIIESALLEAGVEVETSSTKILTAVRRPFGKRAAPRGERRPGTGRDLRGGRTPRKRRRSR